MCLDTCVHACVRASHDLSREMLPELEITCLEEVIKHVDERKHHTHLREFEHEMLEAPEGLVFVGTVSVEPVDDDHRNDRLLRGQAGQSVLCVCEREGRGRGREKQTDRHRQTKNTCGERVERRGCVPGTISKVSARHSIVRSAVMCSLRDGK